MARRWVPLEGRHVAVLQDACSSCTQWLREPLDRSPAPSPADKAEWIDDVRARRGTAGVVALEGEDVVGHGLVAPYSCCPRAGAFPTAPVSDDAVILVGLAAPDAALRKAVVQHLVRELRRAGVAAVEAFGGPDTVAGCLTAPARSGTPCRLPSRELARLGFREVRPHPTAPRYRLEVGSAIPVVEPVRGLVEVGLNAAARALRPGGAEPSLGRIDHC